MGVGLMSDSAFSVGANAVSASLYANKPYEIAPPSILRIRMSAASAGLQSTVLGQGVAIVPDQAIPSTNRWPQLPEDLLIQHDFPGGKLFHTVRNTTGLAITFNHVTEVFF